MTTIWICRDKRKAYRSVICMGHAEYAKAGELDEVCLAVSVTVTNAMNALEALGNIRQTQMQNQETGFLRCDFLDELDEKSTFLMDCMVFSLQQLSEEFSGNVQVMFKSYEEIAQDGR